MRVGKSRVLRVSGRLSMAAVLLLSIVAFAAPAAAVSVVPAFELVSVDSDEVLGAEWSQGAQQCVSDDGRYVAFYSYNVLDPADTNGSSYYDVYRRDRLLGVTELVSEPRVGESYPNAYSSVEAISDDGNRVLFSTGQDLVPEDTNGDYNQYVRDMDTGTYTLIDWYGDASTLSSIDDITLSGNGEVVVCSTRSQISAGDLWSALDVYAYDIDLGTTTWVSAADGLMPEYDRGSRTASITDDGTTVLFFTGKSLDPDDANLEQNFYLCDLATGDCTMVDLHGDGAAVSPDAWDIRISGDGSAFVFASDGIFDLADGGDVTDIYAYDLVTREMHWVTRPPAGASEVSRGARDATISDDGRYVTLFTGKDLAAEDTNGEQDAYIFDLGSGEATVLDLWGDGSSQSSSLSSFDISGDASTIVFQAAYSAYLPADTNGDYDLYAMTGVTVDAGADTYLALRNTTIAVPLAAGVLADDTTTAGDPLLASVLRDVANGTLVLAPDGSFTYTPDPGFQGTDSFTYLATDGVYSGAGLVEIAVVNAMPVVDPESFSVPQDGFLLEPAGSLLTGDTDANGDTLYAFKDSDPAHGTVMVSPDGGFVYTPTAGYFGPDSFTYVANDGQVDSLPATVSLTVVATPANIAPAAVVDSYSTPQDTALYVPEATGLLDNDTDADADGLTAIKVTDPGHGTVTVSSDGSFLYTPVAGYSGADSFTYKANDGTDDSAPATVSLTVIAAPANIAPVAVTEAYVGVEDSALYIPEATGLLLNDTDADSDPLTAIKVTDPAHGTVEVSSNGSFLYTPAAGYAGADSFTYKANDGTDDSAPATVDITVEPADLPLTPIYRFYNRLNATHFYTNSVAEREDVLKRLWGTYTYEGVAFQVDPETDLAPLYRFYNKPTGSHFYTVSADEKAQVEALYSATYAYEGVAFGVSAAAAPGKIPVYRFYNVRTGCHFYTASAAERDTVQATLAGTFLYEGVGFYVSPND